MHVVHGTWVPDAEAAFIQSGGFYLWVETDARGTGGRQGAGNGAHPRQLAGEALTTWLAETLGVRDAFGTGPIRDCETKYILLPSTESGPLPSFELTHYAEEELPERPMPRAWQICCCKIPSPVTALNDIHFRALAGGEDLLLGADLLFWHHFTQSLRAFVMRDEYIPALWAHEQDRAEGRGRRKRGAEGPALELYAGWEWLSDRYESAIARYAAAMPPVCAAVAANPQDGDPYAPESLLRHCAENLLQQIVLGTSIPAKLDQQVAGTLLHRCLHPGARMETTKTPYWPRAVTPAYQPTLDDYRQWRAWRQKLTSTRTASGFALCFRLEEAPPGDNDDWQVQLLVSPVHDPSLKLALADYWPLNGAAKAAIRRQFGEDFEKQLLLALGTAARIYAKIWDGLETDRPSGFRLSLDEAFAFLQESAWVLEDAGFTVIVPAWWTPEGRRRAKIRLKTTARSGRREHGYCQRTPEHGQSDQLPIRAGG